MRCTIGTGCAVVPWARGSTADQVCDLRFLCTWSCAVVSINADYWNHLEVILDWKKYWVAFPKRFSETEFARQVQYTVNGQSIGDKEISDIASGIMDCLSVSKSDSVLDLCCGNGMFTVIFAGVCNEIVGVDYSGPLIEIANKYNKLENTEYFESDAINYLDICSSSGRKFDKIIVNGSFQYFDKRAGRALIAGMARALERDGRILLCGVLDARRKSRFYNTPSKMLRHAWRVLTDREAIGVWWTEGAIRAICDEVGLVCTFNDSQGDSGAHYRFDAILEGKAIGRAGR